MPTPAPLRSAFDTLSPPIPLVGRSSSASPFSPSTSTNSSTSHNPNKNLCSMQPPPRPPGPPAPRFKPNAAFDKLLHTSPVPRTITAAYESSRPQAKKPVGGYSVLSGFGAGSTTTALPRPVPILQRHVLLPPKVEEKGREMVRKTFVGEPAAAQLERETEEGEARATAKRAREEEPITAAPEMKKVVTEKLPSAKKRKSLLGQAMEQHEKLSLPESSSMDIDVPLSADAGVHAQMEDVDAAQQEIQSAPPPEKRRKTNANTAPAETPKITSRAPYLSRATGSSTTRTPSARSARPTQATEETPATRSAKQASTTYDTPTMGTALPETRSSSRLKSSSRSSPVTTMKSPASNSKIPTSTSKTSTQKKPPPPEPATSSRKRNRGEETLDETDIYNFVDVEPVSPPQKKSLPVPVTSPRTTRKTRGAPEIPETPAIAPIASAVKSSTAQKKTPAEPRLTKSVNHDTPVPTATKIKAATSRKTLLPPGSPSSLRKAGRAVIETSEASEVEETPNLKKTSSYSRRIKNKTVEEDEMHPDILEPVVSKTPTPKKSLPRRTNSSRRAAVDKNQEIPETPGSPGLPATKTAATRRSPPLPTTTSPRRRKLKAVAVVGGDEVQGTPQRIASPELLPPPSTMTPAARKAILQRTTSTRRKVTKVEVDAATPATSKPARQTRSSGGKKTAVAVAEDEIPETPAANTTTPTTSKIPTSRSSKKTTATSSTKPTVVIQSPIPATATSTTTPAAGRPRRSLVLSPLSHPPPAETPPPPPPPPKEKSTKSRIPRRSTGSWEGKDGLYNIPSEILASHGSVWDGKSGRRVSGRTNAIAPNIAPNVVEEPVKSVQKKTGEKMETKKETKTETKAKAKTKKVVSYEFSDEEE